MGASSIHFTHAELACSHCGANECTIGLVEALEALRAIISKPIHVHSAYRCPAKNATTPNAAKNSQHQLGLAADISVPDMTAAQLEACAKNVPAIKGIGRADSQNYLHVDVRDTPSRWCYDASGASCKYYPPTTA